MTSPYPPGQPSFDPRRASAPPPPPPPPGGAPQLQPMPQFQSPPAFLPPGMRPPPYFPPPPPRRGGVFKTLFIVLLLILLGGSVILNLALLIGHSSDMGGRQDLLANGDAKNVIAVVPIEGVIDAKMADKFQRIMDRVENDAAVKAVVLRIDTPGGAVTASDEIYQRIQQYKTNKSGVPIVVSMGGMATSGGYYAACAGNKLFAEKTTLTGNIGVLLSMYNFSKLAEKYGVEDATIVSTGATYKNAGSMLKPMNPRDQAYLQGIADGAFMSFKSVVTTGRGKLLKKDIAEIADGRVYTADRALDEGLVDSLGYLQDAWQDAAISAHVSNPQVTKFDERPSLLDLFAAESSFHHGPAGASNVTVNGVNVDLNAQGLEGLMTPRLMYLWRP